MDPLRSLGLQALNPGAGFGLVTRANIDAAAGFSPDTWAVTDSATAFASVNPATEEGIARVTPATVADYERIVDVSMEAFQRWRMVPALNRGSQNSHECAQGIDFRVRLTQRFRRATDPLLRPQHIDSARFVSLVDG